MSKRQQRRGDGSVFQKPDTRNWHMRYSVDGREVSVSTKQTDEAAARAVLEKTLAEIRSGEAVPHEARVTLRDLWDMLRLNYEVNGHRSLPTVKYPFQHLLAFFGERQRALRITTDRLERYVQARQRAGAAAATINLELGLLGRAFNLAIRAKRLGRNRRPFLPKLAADESRVRQGFFTREDVDRLCTPCDCPPGTRRGPARDDDETARCWHLPEVLADVVRFLFWSALRVGEVTGILIGNQGADFAHIRIEVDGN